MKQSDTIFPTDMRLIVLRALYGDKAPLAEPVLFKPDVKKHEVVKVPFALFVKGVR